MENIRQHYKNSKLKIIVPTWNDEFEFSDGSYSASDIKDYFECIIKKPDELPNNLPVHIYINRINNVLAFKIKDGYKLELQIPETMKLFRTLSKINRQYKQGKNVTRLEGVYTVLVQFNLVDNQYQQKC